MGYDTYRQTGSNGAGAAVAVLVLVVVLGGLLTLGGGAFYWLQTAKLQRRAVTEQERAMFALRRVRQARWEAQMTAGADELAEESTEVPAEIDVAALAELVNPDLYQTTIKLDNQGKIEVNGHRVRLDELYGVLSRDEDPYRLSVVVKAEDECPFKHVAGVLSLCEQIGIADVHVAASTSD